MTLPPPIPDSNQTVDEEVIIITEAETEPDNRCVTPPPVPQYPQPRRVEIEDMPPMPKTYLVWNLVLCLLCIITGIIGLVFSSKVAQEYNAGDYDGAVQASKNAKLMVLASVVMGLVNVPFLILYIALT